MQVEHLTVGSGTSVDVSIDDRALSRLHLSVYREDDRVWVMDEDSANGSWVNGVQVPASGSPLNDGDKISIGECTTIWVAIRASGRKQSKNATVPWRSGDERINGGSPYSITIII